MSDVILIKPKYIMFIYECQEEYNSINEKTYEDVTELWLLTANPNSHEVKDRTYFEHEGVKYIVDGKKVVLDYSSKEKEVAEWLENIFGGEIYMIPRINKPEGIKTPDYLFKNEYWDLKEIKVSSKNVIDNRVNGLKKQTHNFIFDISDNLLSNEEVIKQLISLYFSPKRDWIDKIVLIRDYKLTKVLRRKKD